MYKITIKGEASTDYANLAALDGIDCQEEFTEFFSGKYKDNENEQALIDKGVCNGYMNFEYKNGKLWTVTTYDSPVQLTEDELNILADYTQGQWSDGIGEGFEQEPCMCDDDDEDVYISPWSRGQKLITEQKEVN
jgi:hypothetical protein